ncbi:MAG TPA: DUF1127 domain-containing protein [Bauldia sp.]|jgi:uncharacterized protein YjiS (DUF1127 family)|nr:DUF1127 domain-containing protein [Bauldia sp.]
MLLIRLFGRVADYRQRRRTALALSSLSERDLRDLGITRFDLRRSAQVQGRVS